MQKKESTVTKRRFNTTGACNPARHYMVDITERLENYPELKEVLRSTLLGGERIVYNPDNSAYDIAMLFGFVKNGRLDMELLLTKFVEHFDQIYGDHVKPFDEMEGRRRFLLYLRPIINGTGNYYIEAETRNARRMDVVVDYQGEQFIVELKIWRGDAYNERGEEQLSEYLEYFHLKKGYMLSYNFNQKKKTGVHTISLGDRTLVEAVV